MTTDKQESQESLAGAVGMLVAFAVFVLPAGWLVTVVTGNEAWLVAGIAMTSIIFGFFSLTGVLHFGWLLGVKVGHIFGIGENHE